MTLTPEQIKKYSEIMARFEGLTPETDSKGLWIKHFRSDSVSRPKYHTDYNWLMRVWLKFRDLDLTKFERELYYMHSKLRKDLDFIITRKPKEEAFINLGEAIEWYQNLKSTP